MKNFDKIGLVLIVICLIVLTFANTFISNYEQSDGNREYNVEVKRLCDELEKGNIPKTSDCKYVISFEEYPEKEEAENIESIKKDEVFFNSQNDYIVKSVNGKLYRFDYNKNLVNMKKVKVVVNATSIFFILIIVCILLYTRFFIIRPFNNIVNLPYELAKGNLTNPIKEQKNRFFGKFIWGINMLREKLEENKKKELELKKEKQTLLLSISHDIKTPLQAIKLYSKALSKGLYKDLDKQLEVVESIEKNADDIEKYIGDIVHSLNDELFHYEVKNEEVYLSSVIDEISFYYKDKLLLNKIPFEIEDYKNCIIKADRDRCIEVIQNIMENAIKYGDGRYIKISFDEEEGYVLITITNSGCELSEQELIHIFDSFWRGSNTTNKNGSGLGLYIARQLMFKMNGDIYAKIKDKNMNVTLVLKK